MNARRFTILIILGLLAAWLLVYRAAAGQVAPPPDGPMIGDIGIEWWLAEGNQLGASFGRVVRSAGDVNGDGYDDAAIGASNHDRGEIDEGITLVMGR